MSDLEKALAIIEEWQRTVRSDVAQPGETVSVGELERRVNLLHAQRIAAALAEERTCYVRIIDTALDLAGIVLEMPAVANARTFGQAEDKARAAAEWLWKNVRR
jgi:hypothetical protein